MSKTVLVIGSGGREHALAYGLVNSTCKPRVFACPGNGGTATLPRTKNITLTEHADVIAFCQKESVDMVVIGPEAPLLAGLSDALRAAGIVTFGASQAAAQLEGSKSFATEFMQENNIPIPESRVVHDANEAADSIEQFGGPEESVIKADGFAAGKGVFLPDTAADATAAIQQIVNGAVDGDGSTFVIQKRHTGPEVSIFILSDGSDYQMIPLACQDHKRLLAGDKGPNTGGMGVYAPLPEWMLHNSQWAKIHTIAKQTIEGMKQRGTPYEGVLYLGLMLSEQRGGDPIVIEYNARFGDPEAEVIIPLLMRNAIDIYDMLHAVAIGSLPLIHFPKQLEGSALTICLAVPGYPNKPISGQVIHGLEVPQGDAIVFHGGTKVGDSGATITSGGRALYVTGTGLTLQQASDVANRSIGNDGVNFSGMQYRHDIGHRAFKGRPTTNH